MVIKINIVFVFFCLFIISPVQGQSPQTALGHVVFVKNGVKDDYKVTLYRSNNKDKAVLIGELKNGNISYEISIKYYEEIWKYLESVDQRLIARKVVYCLDDHSTYEISYGISDDIRFTINCLSDFSNDQKLLQVIELFDELVNLN
jgi:hypothetical protein